MDDTMVKTSFLTISAWDSGWEGVGTGAGFSKTWARTVEVLTDLGVSENVMSASRLAGEAGTIDLKSMDGLLDETLTPYSSRRPDEYGSATGAVPHMAMALRTDAPGDRGASSKSSLDVRFVAVNETGRESAFGVVAPYMDAGRLLGVEEMDWATSMAVGRGLSNLGDDWMLWSPRVVSY